MEQAGKRAGASQTTWHQGQQVSQDMGREMRLLFSHQVLEHHLAPGSAGVAGYGQGRVLCEVPGLMG